MEKNYHLNNFQMLNNYGFVNKFNYGAMKDEYLEMYLIRLDLIKEIVYNKKKKRLVRWLKLIKANSFEETRKIAGGDEIMERAIEFMERFVNDEEVCNIYDKINDAKLYAKEEGVKEGILETAKKMLSDGMNISTIMKYTNLTKHEIEALR